MLEYKPLSRACFLSMAVHVALLSMPAGGVRVGPVVLTRLEINLLPPSSKVTLSDRLVPLRSSTADSGFNPTMRNGVLGEEFPDISAAALEDQWQITDFANKDFESGLLPTYYWSPHELEILPDVLSVAGLDSISGLESGLNGHVVLEVFLNESGRPDAILPLESNLPERVSAHLVEVFSNAKYQPGRFSGKPVGSRFKIEVTVGQSDQH